MKTSLSMNEHLQGLAIKLDSLQDLKLQIRSHQKMLINKLKLSIKNLNTSVRKNAESGETQVSELRKCSNCGEESEFETYTELEEFVSEQNEKTDHEGCVECCEIVTETE